MARLSPPKLVALTLLGVALLWQLGASLTIWKQDVEWRTEVEHSTILAVDEQLLALDPMFSDTSILDISGGSVLNVDVESGEPALVPGGVAQVKSNGAVEVVESNGEIRWRITPFEGDSTQFLLVDPDAGVVVVSSVAETAERAETTRGLDLATGEELWSHTHQPRGLNQFTWSEAAPQRQAGAVRASLIPIPAELEAGDTPPTSRLVNVATGDITETVPVNPDDIWVSGESHIGCEADSQRLLVNGEPVGDFETCPFIYGLSGHFAVVAAYPHEPSESGGSVDADLFSVNLVDGTVTHLAEFLWGPAKDAVEYFGGGEVFLWSHRELGTHVVNLRTGQELWSSDTSDENTTVSVGGDYWVTTQSEHMPWYLAWTPLGESDRQRYHIFDSSGAEITSVWAPEKSAAVGTPGGTLLLHSSDGVVRVRVP